jgi:hypothetical protein
MRFLKKSRPERAPQAPSCRSLRLETEGIKGHNMNDITMPGSPGLWAGSFKSLSAQSYYFRTVNPAIAIRKTDRGTSKTLQLQIFGN